MIKRILYSPLQSITGAAILVGSASLVSRIIGMIRDRIFAHYYGVGDVMDAYYAAFKVPDLIYNLLIVGALSAGFIPVFIKAMRKNTDTSWDIVNSIIHIIAIVITAICLILAWQTSSFMHLLVPGFEGEKLDMAVMFTRIMLISPIILGISSVFGSVLQSFKSFAIYSLTPIFYNIGIIIGVTVLVPLIGIAGLAYGVILGAILHLGIQVPFVFRHGYRYRTTLQLANKAVRTIGRLMIPRMLGMATRQINLIAITILASLAGPGALAIFTFADNLQSVPSGIIGISFGIAIFPTLSELASQKNFSEIKEKISRTTRQILWLIIPATILLLILRAQIVRVILGTGAFDWDATIATAQALAFFSISLFAQALIPMLARAFYAFEDTWTPFVIGLISAGINISIGMYAISRMGITGLILGYSMSMIVQCILLWMFLRIKVGSLNESKIIITLLKISISALGMGITIQALKYPIALIVDMQTFIGILTQGLLAGIGGIIVYGILCHMLRLEEMRIFILSLRKKWLKVKTTDADIGRIEHI